jgi:hypothetical protein
MAANPSVANPNSISDTEQAISESSKLKLTSLLERCEEVLCKAFGDDQETIANSLRGL